MAYLVHYTYRQWIGKSDPSGFGTACFVAKTKYEALAKREALRRNGHRVDKIVQGPNPLEPEVAK